MNRKHILSALWLSVALSAPLVSAAQQPDAARIAEWRDKAKTLKARWVPILDMARIPGVAVAVVAGDEVILLETYGLRDTQKKLLVNEDTLFYKASSTKSFTAMAVVMLAAEGKLDLDAPVKKYLPRFEVADAKATESITLRDLLAHRPGLNEEAITFHEAYSGQINEELFYRLLKRARVRGSFAYSNLHFTLLGRVIQADGEALARVPRRANFQACGHEAQRGHRQGSVGRRQCRHLHESTGLEPQDSRAQDGSYDARRRRHGIQHPRLGAVASAEP